MRVIVRTIVLSPPPRGRFCNEYAGGRPVKFLKFFKAYLTHFTAYFKPLSTCLSPYLLTDDGVVIGIHELFLPHSNRPMNNDSISLAMQSNVVEWELKFDVFCD